MAATAFLSNTLPSFGIDSGLNASSTGKEVSCHPVFKNVVSHFFMSCYAAAAKKKSITCMHSLLIISRYSPLKLLTAHQLLRKNHLCTRFETHMSQKCTLCQAKLLILR